MQTIGGMHAIYS